MINYIKGYVEYIGEDYIVIETNDIGYKVMTSWHTIADLKGHSEKVCIFTELIVREDSMTLVGFREENELKLFKLLTSVSGVGAKVGIAILSSIPYTSLYTMLVNGDVNGLTKANGVGKKTAQRIALELKEKVKKALHITVDHGMFVQQTLDMTSDSHTNFDEAKEALLSLGYTHKEINEAMSKISQSNKDTETIVKLALKALMNS